MLTYETTLVEQRQFKELTCDKCGKILTNSSEDQLELQETYSINFHGGYSSVFGDMDHVTCDLCQSCLFELIGDFCKYNEEY